MFRLVPPAGTGLSIVDVVRIKTRWLAGSHANSSFMDELRRIFKAKFIFPVNSGRTGLTLAIKAISSTCNRDKDEIVLPAYTCFSVAASAARSGHRIRLIDVDPNTMDFDKTSLARTDFSRVAGIVVSSLFGIGNDWKKIKEIAAANNIRLIDDAAQALGESRDGIPCGTSGDIGFYSFGRGKNVSVYSGGVIVTNDDELAERLRRQYEVMASPGILASVCALTKMGVYSLMSRPRLFWLPAMLPFLGIGETVYEDDFAMERLSSVQSCGLSVVMNKLPQLRKVRIENSVKIGERLRGISGLTFPGYHRDSCPAFIRLPVMIEDGKRRDAIVRRLRKGGIVASTMYPFPIDRIKNLDTAIIRNPGEFPGAQAIVERLVTLPTHPYLTERDIERMTRCFER